MFHLALRRERSEPSGSLVSRGIFSAFSEMHITGWPKQETNDFEGGYGKRFLSQISQLDTVGTNRHSELYDYAGMPIEVRWNGISLPYRVFSKDQRVTTLLWSKTNGWAML